MARLSQTHRFQQSPSFRQVQSALIVQPTPQARNWHHKHALEM